MDSTLTKPQPSCGSLLQAVSTPKTAGRLPARLQAFLHAAAPLLLVFAIFLPYRLVMARHDPNPHLILPLSSELRAAPWKLLLPVDNFTGGRYRWSVTAYAIIGLLDLAIPAPAIYILCLSALMMTAYLLSWQTFGSRVFSATLALCLGVGTQFDYTYVHNVCSSFVLLVLYAVVNLYFVDRLLRGVGADRFNRIGFVLSLIALALSWEQWLDYLAFLALGGAFALVLLVRHPRLRIRTMPPLKFVALSSAAVATVYLLVKWSTIGEHLTPGHESDTIFTYRHRLLMVDDFVGNVFTYLYMAFANFLPWVSTSASMHFYGPQTIVAEQAGYHADKAYLVPMHHQFLWYFPAGVVVCLFGMGLYRSIRAALREPTRDRITVLAMLLLVLTGCATHCLIKYRPYLSSPILTYKCILSVLGVALLLCFGLMQLYRKRSSIRPAWRPVALVWIFVLAGALFRPSQLAVMAQGVGLSGGPDPLAISKRALERWR